LRPAADHFVAHDRFETVAERVLETHSNRIEANPMEHASLVLAADQYSRGALELTLAADEAPESWRETLAETYLPDRLLAWRPATADGMDGWLETLGLDEAPPIWGRAEPAGRRADGVRVSELRLFAAAPRPGGGGVSWSPGEE